MIQFVQRPGEAVFLPSGVPHAVLNLGDSVAVTRNHLFVDALASESIPWPFWSARYFGRRYAGSAFFPFSELVAKMALDEISPFRPRWSEERAFKRLYFHWVNAQVTTY